MSIPRTQTVNWGALVLATSLVGVACSGEAPAEDDGAGGSVSLGGTKSTGGAKSTGGTSGSAQSGGRGGLGGDEGVGGSKPAGGNSALGGLGGALASTGGASSGGSGGTTGTGGATAISAPITRLHDVVVGEVDDLRGLSYAASGKLYASGYALDEAGDRHTVVLRFEQDGALDETFATGGVAQFNLVEQQVEEEPGLGGAPPVLTVTNDGSEESLGVVELGDGSLLVQLNLRRAGGEGTRVALLKLDSNGDVIETFGESGIAPVVFGFAAADAGTWSDSAWGLALDTASETGIEKVVVFGFGTAPLATTRIDNDRYVARLLTSDGTPDPAFNGGGTFTLNSSGILSDGGRRGIVLDDGSIVSSGYTNFGENFGNHVLLIKLTPAGALDATFGFGAPGAGVARFNPFLEDGGVAECYDVTVQSSGRLITTGYGTATAVATASSLGYLTTVKQDMVSFGVLAGGLDESWSSHGHLAVQSEDEPPELGLEALAAERFEERGRALVALPDDRVVYAGRYDLRPALMVGRANGGLDETLGDQLSGRFSYDALSPDTSHFYAIAVSEDGTRVTATTNYNVGAEGVLLATLKVGQ